MSGSSLPEQKIQDAVLRRFPGVTAIYLFGSAAQGTARPDSDVDLALLMQKAPTAEAVLSLKGDLGALLRKDVDLVDLLRADSVTKAQVITGGQLLYDAAPTATALFETTALSLYAQLNTERREIIEDIVSRGNVRGG